jgi:mRNA interferase MazF
MSDPQRGEVWRADLEPTRGDEIRKVRPVVILSDDGIGKLRLRIIVPVTDWDERYRIYPWMTRLEPDTENGLTKVSAADAFQVRSVSFLRLQARIGTLPEETVDSIATAIVLSIGYKIPV